ncbi:unnamed protein product, partial [Mesorhabditis belari]|uniref:Uncharacterized protein n=1 Tax=Mesorhabditis belari TaxID=2138241 RepID=A0AAF3FBS5_9BILA
METRRRSARLQGAQQKLSKDDDSPKENPKKVTSAVAKKRKSTQVTGKSISEPLQTINKVENEGASPPKRPRKVQEPSSSQAALKELIEMKHFANTSDSEEEIPEGKKNVKRNKATGDAKNTNSHESKSTKKRLETRSEVLQSPQAKPSTARPRRRTAQVTKKYIANDGSEESDLSSVESVSCSSFEETSIKLKNKGMKQVSTKPSSSSSDSLPDSNISDEEVEAKRKGKNKKTTVRRRAALIDYRAEDDGDTKDDDGETKKQRPERCFMSKRWKAWHTDPEHKPSGDIAEEPAVRNAGENTIVAGDRNDSKEQPKWVTDCLSIAASLARHRTEEVTLDETAHIMYILKMREKEQTLGEIASDIQSNKGDFLKKGTIADYHSSSEDEWEEMEAVEEKPETSTNKKLEITLDKKKVEIDWSVKWLRQEINKCVRAKYENAHKLHILFWISYLHRYVKRALDENLATSLALSQIPSGYAKLVDNSKPPMESLKKFAKWIHSAFKQDSNFTASMEEWGCRFQETADSATSIREKSFANDIQRAIAYLVCFRALNLSVRLVANCQVLARKKEVDENVPKKGTKIKGKNAKSKRVLASPKVDDELALDSKRNFWIEWWSIEEKRWICIDPLTGEADIANEFEPNLTSPAVYIFACDQKGCMRDVGARYLSTFGTPIYRRQRAEQSWLNKVFNSKIILADKSQAQLENMCFQNDLASRPLPKTVADYKDHPLYVLEKDLLKFQGMYPPPSKQKPIGEIRGQKIYPRSTVYHLQGDLNWVKIARSVKENEKPYKVVKARPNMRVPAEKRGEPKDLPLYGFWQTEPYRVPIVTNGVIPRNQYGNIYVYQDSMVPKECVHLKLPGIVGLCRRLNKEHVAAVVGWDFHVSANHPVIEGAVVLERDVEELIAEWEAAENRRKERERKRREGKVLSNWRILIKGILRLHHMRYIFGEKPQTVEKAKEGEEDQLPDEKVEAEAQAAWPAPKFALERMEKK